MIIYLSYFFPQVSALQKNKTQQAVKGFLGLDPQNSCVHTYFESFYSGNYFYKCMILKKTKYQQYFALSITSFSFRIQELVKKFMMDWMRRNIWNHVGKNVFLRNVIQTWIWEKKSISNHYLNHYFSLTSKTRDIACSPIQTSLVWSLIQARRKKRLW